MRKPRSSTHAPTVNAMHRRPDPTVLIVESDAGARSGLRALFERDGYTVVATSGADDALFIVDNPRITLVVTELYLENRKSRCLLNAICQPSPHRRTKVLAYTRHGRPRDRAWAVAAGADGYVLKKNGEARLLEVAGRLSRRA
jgi:two-component system chemotaxis sensor kinase CheA